MEIFNSNLVNNIGINPVILHTTTATTVLLGCNVANLLHADLPIDIWIDRAGVVVYLIKAGRVDANRNFEVIQSKTVLKIGDVLKASATVPNAFDITLSYIYGVVV